MEKGDGEMSHEYMESSVGLEKPIGTRVDKGPLTVLAYVFIKRVFDVIVSFCGIVALCPVFLLLSCIIYAADPGPVFYRHERMGKGGKKIRIWKFRSMYINSEEIFENFTEEQKEEYYADFKLENAPRITKIGNFLRKSSLDELPQLWNIFCGDLSFVGPRPIVEGELAKYGADAKKLLSVKPGLTGYWQANGRNLVNYDNGRKEMELYYIENRSVWLDTKILFQTAGAVLRGRGAQ